MEGSKKTQTRPKVRQNLGEPTRFRLQDEPDTNQPPEQQPYYPHPIQPSQNQQQHYPQPYENRPYIPPFSTQNYPTNAFQNVGSQPSQPFASQPSQPYHPSQSYHPSQPYHPTQSSQPSHMSVDPLNNNDVIHEFANAFHDVQPLGVDEDDSEDCEGESSPRNRKWLPEEEVALTKAYLHCSESKKH